MFVNQNIAVIPARAGSKGIPNKNIIDFGGKPLLAWTIEAAKESQCFDHVFVSTDSEKIARLSKRYGAEVPFLRPKELATDEALAIDVDLHALRWIKSNWDFMPSHITHLQPTSPFRNAQHIREAVELFYKSNASALISVCPVKEHPYLMKKIDSHNFLVDLIPESSFGNRQDLEQFYILNGAIYIASSRLLLSGGDWHSAKALAYPMSRGASLDIDTPDDLRRGSLQLEGKILWP